MKAACLVHGCNAGTSSNKSEAFLSLERILGFDIELDVFEADLRGMDEAGWGGWGAGSESSHSD